MAQPPSIKNVDSQSIDTLYGADGVGRIKLAVGDKAVTGLTPHAAWEPAATHADGDAFGTSDGVVAVAGVTSGGLIRRIGVNATGGIAATVAPSAGALTDRSGTITTGGTSQDLAASNTNRWYLLVQNTDETATGEALWINFTTAATAAHPSIKLFPGDTFVMEGSFVSSEKVTVVAATTGHTFTAKEG